MDVQCHVAAAWTSFARLPVKIAHALFVFIAVTQLLQNPLSKDPRRLARKASELQVTSQLARPETYVRINGVSTEEVISLCDYFSS